MGDVVKFAETKNFQFPAYVGIMKLQINLSFLSADNGM